MKLSFTNGPRKGEEMTLQPPGVCIGRESDNDIQLLVAGVSRYHAKISFDGFRWSITDLGSTNGTKVNGRKITEETPLSPGDQLLLGDQALQFGEKSASSSSASPSAEPAADLRRSDNSNADTRDADSLTDGARPAASVPAEKADSGKNSSPRSGTNSASSSNPLRTEETKAPSKGAEKELKSGFAKAAAGNLFGKKSSAANASAEEGDGREKKSKHLPFFFPILVISCAVIILFLFVVTNSGSGTASVPADTKKKVLPDFVIDYERQKVDPDNVFRFAFTLENGTAKFVLDDLKFGRRFEKKFENVNPRFLKDLEDSVRETDFLKLKQEPMNELATDKTDERRRLTVLIDNKQNTITVRNTYAQASFEAIERAIDRFADSNGISSVAMNVEEMRKYAFDTFRKAEDLFQNFEAKPENLREAMTRYQLAMEFLEQFVPRPAEWDIARKRCEEARQIYERKLKDIEFNIQRYYKLRQWANASAECQKGMDMVQPDSKAYQNLKKYKLTFDRQMRK